VKDLPLSALAVVTLVLVGCNEDPTPVAFGSGVSVVTVVADMRVADYPTGDAGGASASVSAQAIEFDIPGGAVNLNSKGKLKVVIPTTETFDAAEVDPGSVTLGDGVGADAHVHRKKNGKSMARLEDDDGDGDLDLVLHFAVQELVANGDLAASVTELIIRGATRDNREFLGSAGVTAESSESKRFYPPAPPIESTIRTA
jgi:hypothetical protein